MKYLHIYTLSFFILLTLNGVVYSPSQVFAAEDSRGDKTEKKQSKENGIVPTIIEPITEPDEPTPSSNPEPSSTPQPEPPAPSATPEPSASVAPSPTVRPKPTATPTPKPTSTPTPAPTQTPDPEPGTGIGGVVPTEPSPRPTARPSQAPVANTNNNSPSTPAREQSPAAKEETKPAVQQPPAQKPAEPAKPAKAVENLKPVLLASNARVPKVLGLSTIGKKTSAVLNPNALNASIQLPGQLVSDTKHTIYDYVVPISQSVNVTLLTSGSGLLLGAVSLLKSNLLAYLSQFIRLPRSLTLLART